MLLVHQNPMLHVCLQCVLCVLLVAELHLLLSIVICNIFLCLLCAEFDPYVVSGPVWDCLGLELCQTMYLPEIQ